MSNTVLCPIDLAHEKSLIALEEAVRQAKLRSAGLHLLTVVPDLEFMAVAEHLPASFADDAARSALERLHQIRDANVPTDLDCEAHIGHGHAAEQILEFADRLEVGLIVMSSHHPDRLRTLFVGSVADKIVHNASQSVLVVRA